MPFAVRNSITSWHHGQFVFTYKMGRVSAMVLIMVPHQSNQFHHGQIAVASESSLLRLECGRGPTGKFHPATFREIVEQALQPRARTRALRDSDKLLRAFGLNDVVPDVHGDRRGLSFEQANDLRLFSL